MNSNIFIAPHDFNLQIQRAKKYRGKQKRAVLSDLEQQTHNLLLLTAQKHYNNIRPDDIAYFMTYVQWLSRDILKPAENKREQAAGEMDDADSLIFKLQRTEAHFA